MLLSKCKRFQNELFMKTFSQKYFLKTLDTLTFIWYNESVIRKGDKKMKELIKQNGGATIKKGAIVNYKSGYQVCVDSKEKRYKRLGNALRFNKKLKSIGLWFSNGLWFVDTNSIRVNTKKQALELAKQNEQLAIWNWKKQETVYLN